MSTRDWLLVIAAIVILCLLIWWWWRRRAAPALETRAPAPIAPAPAAAPPPPDDLTIVEGIGPKIASLLQQAGITTFAQLAQTDVSKLEAILRQAALPFADPGTWPEQARLAAAGKLDELKTLQESLRGGRRA